MGIFGKTHQFTNIKNPQKFLATLHVFLFWILKSF